MSRPAPGFQVFHARFQRETEGMIRGGSHRFATGGQCFVFRSRNITGEVSVVNANGKVTAREIKGAAKLETRFGAIDASGIAGDATVANGNSSITLTDVEGSADVRGSFGEIHVIRVKKGAKVSSGNGRISDESLHGKIGDGRCELTLTDNNGTIDLLKGR